MAGEAVSSQCVSELPGSRIVRSIQMDVDVADDEATQDDNAEVTCTHNSSHNSHWMLTSSLVRQTHSD